MSLWLIIVCWLIVSIIVGIALGRFLQECEDRECQQRNAPSPATPPTAQDAQWTTEWYIM